MALSCHMMGVLFERKPRLAVLAYRQGGEHLNALGLISPDAGDKIRSGRLAPSRGFSPGHLTLGSTRAKPDDARQMKL